MSDDETSQILRATADGNPPPHRAVMRVHGELAKQAIANTTRGIFWTRESSRSKCWHAVLEFPSRR
ncbi:MAG TPA: hypothetical protein VFR66_11325 [Burkholderiales bacterium]|nr:hypothetical protein [Burkholderiales bacterium]